MSVIIELQCRERVGMKGHRVDFTRVSLDGENCNKGIV